MWMATCSADGQQWSSGELLPYGPLPMYPSAQALNYGQAVFEGMKAQRSAKVRPSHRQLARSHCLPPLSAQLTAPCRPATEEPVSGLDARTC